MGQEIIEESQENWKMKVIFIGGMVGLLTGVTAAYLLVQRAERAGDKPMLSSTEGVKLGLLVMGLLRQVTQLGEGK